MYSVLASGGKQYRVQPGDVLQVEKLEGEVGSQVQFDQVLFVSKQAEQNPTDSTQSDSQVWLGKPLLANAKVEAEIVGQGRGDKILIVKMKRRKQYRRTQGHRQNYTELLVTSVDNGAGEKMVLPDDDKKARLGKFHSGLKPQGPSSTAPTVGSRKRLAQAAARSVAEKSEKRV